MAKEQTYRQVFGNIDLISYLFTLLIFCSGVFSFCRSSSLISFLSGTVFAILLAIGSYKTSLNRKNYHFTISISACLCILMGYRYVLTNKFIPAGLLSSLSISMIIYLLARVKIAEIVNKKANENKET